jgi:mannose-6-phosphate isomerase-like protein (cupin superfamily)
LSSDLDRKEEKLAMSTPNIVVPPRQDPVAPGRSYSVKLRGGETGDSIMTFEEIVPAGTKSTFHLHHDSDEVAYVLSGEVTFMIGGEISVGGPGACAFMPRGVPHAWKSTGAETGRVLFLYAPGKAGGFIEEQHRTERTRASMTESERAEMLQRYGWELLGPSPL